MPFVNPEIGKVVIQDIPQEDIDATVPSLKQVYGSAFRQENSFVSSAARGFGLFDFQEEEGYDPFEADLSGYEMFAENFIESKSRAETMMIKSSIDQELEDRKTLDAAGWSGVVAQMAAGVTDPIYLPLMASGIGAIRLGGSSLKAFGQASAIGAISEIPAEAVKLGTQETRTIEESAFNVGGAALLSGILGSAVSSLSKSEFDPLAKAMHDALVKEEGSLSVGAAKVNELSKEDLQLVKAGKLEKIGVSPLIRTSISDSVESRRVTNSMMESPLVTEGNVRGLASAPEGGAVETRIKRWDAPLANAVFDIKDQYLSYRKSKSVSGAAISDFVTRNKAGKLGFSEFREEIGKAMVRGDDHIIPEVSIAAKKLRAVVDKLKDAAVEGKLLPQGIKPSTARSYLMRVYNTSKVVAKSDEFDAISRKWMQGIKKSAVRKKVKAENSGKKVSNSLRGEAGITDLEIEEVVRSIRNNITGVASGRAPYDIKIAERGPFKDRVFLINDTLIEEFLEKDVDIIMRQMVRTMAPDIELNRMFGEVDGKGVIESITNDYNKIVDNAKTDVERTAVNKRRKQDIVDIEAMWARLRGTYRTPENPDEFFVRAGRALRDINFVRMLGGMVLSAIPDAARPIAVNGLKPVGRALVALASSPKKFKMSVEEAKKAAVGLDMVLNSRASSIADIADVYGRHTKFERGLRAASDVFSKITLMAPWNAALKQFSGVVTQDRILTQAVKFSDGTISPSNKRRMASAGIDRGLAERIAKQFKKHGDAGSLNLSNGHLWDDMEAFDAFQSAVLKDVDRTIVTPGEGEKPLWTSAQTGKMVFQFKTFASAAHHKILIADLQHGDAAALNGFLMATALGTLSYGAKQYVADRKVSSDPAVVIAESLDRSGVFGYFWDINNITEKLTRGEIGVNAIVGGPPMSRYASRNLTGALLGPSFGTAQEIFDIAGAASTGEMTKAEARKIRRLMPGQNLFYMRRLLDKLESKAARGL